MVYRPGGRHSIQRNPDTADQVRRRLISYGPDVLYGFRHGAGYVDRILKGEEPADLPVHAPTKYELVVNLKTAKARGLGSGACSSMTV